MATKKSLLSSASNLADFLMKYQQSRGVGSKSYADYMRQYGEDADAKYGAALAAAQQKYDRGTPRYGTQAETLDRAGGVSGYASYLTLRNEETYTRGRDAARATYFDTVDANESGYATWLQSRTNDLRNTIKLMRDSDIHTARDAYAFTLAAGFDEDTARLAGDLIESMEAPAVTATEQRLRHQVLEHIINYGLPLDAAYEYALACGLSPSAAQELAETGQNAHVGRNQTLY